MRAGTFACFHMILTEVVKHILCVKLNAYGEFEFNLYTEIFFSDFEFCLLNLSYVF